MKKHILIILSASLIAFGFYACASDGDGDPIAGGSSSSSSSSSGGSESWAVLGSAGVTTNAVKNPQVAYINSKTVVVFEDNTTNTLKSIVHDGSNWGTETEIDSVNPSAINIAVNNNATKLAITYIDGSDDTAEVHLYDGSTWDDLDSDTDWPDATNSEVDGSSNPSIAFDNTGNLYLAFGAQNDSDKLRIYKWTSSNTTWTSEGTALSEDKARGVSLAINGNEVFVSYQDKNQEYLSVYTDTIGAMASGQYLGSREFNGEAITETTIVRNDGTNTIVLYETGSTATKFVIHNGSSWNSPAEAVSGDVSDQSMTLDSSGNIYLAYRDASDNIKLRKYSSSSWSDVTGTSFPPSGTHNDPSVHVDSDDNIYYAYSDADNSGKLTVMVYK